ncbi:MAG: hypothetical protein E7499_06840 [Ruminococcus sp.]|nr:hypothetical protein [Ruminococcus sp.]
MKRYILMSFVLLIASTTVAQEVYKDEYFELNTSHNQNKSYHYIALDSILLTDGFCYEATDGNMMNLIINPMTTTLPTEGITGGPIAGDDGVVGAIGGTVSVGALGAAVYTIPIEVPAGINGMQPQLAITYNSQAGNGLLGWGWNLSGVSAITRTGKTIYHDKTEFAYPVDFKDDRFLLDGQRLLRVNNIDYGGNQCEYRTEIDNISKIVSEVQNNVTSNFDVWTKGGLKIEYGNTNNSKIKLKNNNDTICMWLVNKVTDLNGNYMTYEYITNETSYRLDKIKYAGNGNVEPEYTIQFNYEERDDVELRFVHNRLIEEKYLLKSIDIKYENDIIYSYSFDYDNINANAGRYYKRLLYVNLEKDDMKLNPTRIEWGTSSDVYDDTRILNTEFNSVSYVGDFNGDGYDDIFSVPNTAYNANFNNNQLICKTLYNNKSGGFTNGSDIIYTKSDGYNLFGVYPCDLNGDGLCDLILHYAKLSDSKVYSQNQMIVYIANENSFVYKGVYNIIYENNENNEIFVGDFLGNGKSDILVIYDIEGVSYYELSSFENDKMQTIIDKTTMPIGFAEKKNIGDFNGDGKMDLMMTNGNISEIYTINKDEYNYPLEKLYESGFPTKYHRVFTGDFNGDGKTDLLTWVQDASPRWQISISKSDGFYHDQFYISNDNGFPAADPGNQNQKLHDAYGEHNMVDYSIKIGDLNGDGKSDVIIVKNDRIEAYYAPLLLTKNTTPRTCRFIDKFVYENGSSGNIQNNLSGNQFGNFFGKGNAILWFRRLPYPDIEHHFINFGKRECQNWVTSISDGMGNKFSFEYDYLSNPDFCHTSPGLVSSTDMVKIITIPFRALRSLSTTNVSENVMETEYKYQNLYYHSKGRGILGFEETSVADITNNIKTVNKTRYASINRLSLPYLLPDSCMTYRLDGNNNIPIKIIDYDNVLISGTAVSNKVRPVSIQLVKQLERNYDMNGEYLNSVITTYEYDNMSSEAETFYGYGNIKTIKKGIADESETSHFDFCNFKETTNITYEKEIVDKWIVDRKKKVVSTSSINKEQNASGIDNNIIQCVSYEYNTSKPHLVSSVKTYSDNNLSDSLMTEVRYSYSFSGNLISSITETLSAPNDDNAINRSTVTQYSSDYNYKFPTKTTNALGYETTTKYDEAFGWKTSETDANGLSTIIDNDFFGINTCVITADGLESAASLRWSDGHPDAPANAAYYSWSQNSGEYPALTFYHKTGAELRNVTYGFSGEEIYVDKFYDAKGNLSGESLPYKKSAGIGGVMYYSYDELNRLVRTDYPDNSSVIVVYDGNKTTTTFTGKNGGTQSSSKTYHGNGWLKKSVDTGGNAVCNIYNADGTLHSTYIEGFNDTVSFSYNSAGMKTRIDDPDYGVMKYRYNAFGELMSQTSPKNITTSYEYDILGRTVSRSVLNNTNGNEELTAWFYENNANGKKGTLKAILHDNNSVSYQYDNLLRLTSESETFDGMTYNTSYTYDQYGRLNKTTYPSGFVTFNAYNEGGFLCVIKDSDKKMLWQANQYNAMGQLINCRSGNMISTNKTYEANTGRLTRIRTSLGSNILQNIVYSYDDFGNFASRRNITGLVYNEHFTYDDFNRLTSSSMGDEECKMTYDKYGRILSKKSYNMSFLDARYHSDKPHALKKYTSYTEPPYSGQILTYTDFDKVETVSMDGNTLQFAYGHDHHRRHMTETVDSVTRSKTYIGNCEFVQSATDGEYSLTYLYGGDGIFAVVKKSAGVETVYYVHTDHLGSWSLITDKNSNVLQRCYFDAWGDVSMTNGNGISVDKLMFDRGFTGHEHHYDFGLINMNGRMYDPYTSMFLSPDNYIQAPDNSQSFNRYAYCLNNPLKYTDPSGESFIGATIAIGAIIGAYSGGVLANGTYNPIEWNWSSGNTYAYMIGGAIVGGVSAYGGVAIAAQDFAFCNTLGVMTSSTINSLGTKLYTGGKTDLTMSFGIASYNFTQNKWGYIGKKGNSILQNAGYLLGGIYNAVDICKFITWDMLSIEDRFTKLENYAQSHKKEFGEIIMEYKGYKKGKSGDFNPNNNHIYIYKDGLSKGWGWAKSTLCHEVKHKFDFMMSDYINDGNSYIYQLEYKAYGFEVQNAKFNGLSWTQYRKVVNNYYYNARMYEVNNLQLFSNYNFKNYWSWLKNSLGL